MLPSSDECKWALAALLGLREALDARRASVSLWMWSASDRNRTRNQDQGKKRQGKKRPRTEHRNSLICLFESV